MAPPLHSFICIWSQFAQNQISSASSSVETSPQKVRERSDRIINDLNLRYGLKLPGQHGVPPQTLLRSQISREQRISAQIRFLFWKSSVDVNEVIRDFEEWAQAFLSNWIHKPSQEPGTILSQSITTFFIRDGATKTAASFTKEQKDAILQDLERRLREECDLANSSEVYERQSTKMEPPPTKKAAAKRKSERSSQTNRIDTSLKRRKPSSGSLVVPPTITPLLAHFTIFADHSGQDVSLSKHQSPSQLTGKPSDGALSKKSSASFSEANQLSFATATSSDIPRIFTEPNTPEPQSTATTFDGADDAASELDSQSTRSQDLFPEIAQAYFIDEEYRRSINEACGDSFAIPNQIDDTSYAGKLSQELSTNGPFQMEIFGLWGNAPFRNRWEIHRVSTGLDVASTELLAIKLLRQTRDHQLFWQHVNNLPGTSPRKLPHRSSFEAWEQAENRYEDPKSSESVVFSGTLTWREASRAGLFDLSLNPLKLEKSCRFHRRFGSDRFLVLQFPSLSTHDLPSHMRRDDHDVRTAVSHWLSKTVHHLLGRQWRAFYVEEAKRASKAKTPRGYKVHLFAIDGDDFAAQRKGTSALATGNDAAERRPISIEEFLNWHIPFADNQKSTDCKLFQRLALGLSKTYPTISFKAAEFVWLKDGDPVMNDGCARISQTAANEIADQLGLQNTPSVFQGRIAGAKGVWMVEKDDVYRDVSERNYWIEITDSQLKVLPHPRDSPCADVEQRTFEVTEHSRPPRVAAVTKQLLMILHDRGVPTEVFEKLMLTDMREVFDTLKESMSNGVWLRYWIQRVQNHSRSPGGIQCLGSWPTSPEEQAIFLIDSGFTPEDCPALLKHLRKFLAGYFDRYIEKLAIRIPQTTDVYCIADPYGILAYDEVHLGFSEVWSDPKSGRSDNILDGFDVLVARSPAHLPSDIQRRKASWRRELRHFKDVVVFPTTGSTALASMLSGGDYDGDRVWICWDQAVVLPFQNVEPQADPLGYEECGMTQVSRKISTIFEPQRSTDEAVNDLLEACFRFNLNPGLLGLCTNQHEKVIYHDGSLVSPGAIRLAALAGHLVDRSKQGLSLSIKNWQKVQSETGCLKLREPAYKTNIPPIKCINIIDRLKFDLAVPRREDVLTEFSAKWPERAVKDSDLAKPLELCKHKIRQEKSGGQISAMEEIIEDLTKRLSRIIDQWVANTVPGKLEKSPEGFFDRLVQNLCDEVHRLEPVHPEHPTVSKGEWETTSSRWESLRASCIYDKQREKPFSWYMVGPDLCTIKLGALKERTKEPSRQVMPKIYTSLNVNANIVRRMQEQKERDCRVLVPDEDAEDSD